MKIRRVDRIPRLFPSHPGLMAQGQFKLHPRSPWAKVVVFSTPRHLQKFWVSAPHHLLPLGDSCVGAVSDLTCQVHNATTGEDRWEIDERHFCLIGLTKAHLGMEVITHECVHVGHAFDRRVGLEPPGKRRTPWDAQVVRFPEEGFAYPAGIAGRKLVNFLSERGFYP